MEEKTRSFLRTHQVQHFLSLSIFSLNHENTSIMEHPAFTLSALVTIGGSMGYLRKKSVPSLVAGLVFGGVYGYAGYLLKQNRDGGLELALGASSLMLVTGIARGIPGRFKKPVPLILTILGGFGTTYYFRKYKEFYP